MEAGKLRHRVVIQENTPTRDSYGDEVDSWSTWATVWGAVEPLTGREAFSAGANQRLAEVTHRIRIRYRSGVLPTMRVTWRSRTFNIQSVIEPETRDREIQLMCEELPDG